MTISDHNQQGIYHTNNNRLMRTQTVQAILLSGVILLLIALGWYLAIRQKQTLNQAAITAYQRTQLEIVRAAARSAIQYVHDQVHVHSRIDISRIEQEVLRKFIAPIQLLQNGDAWIYAPTHVVFDLSSDFPNMYRGKSMAQIFALQVEKGASHYEAMTEAVMNAREGVGWYIWLPDKGKEIAAWTPVQVGKYIWTIGLSTPLPEILASIGANQQLHTAMTTLAVGTLVAMGLLSAWLFNTIRRFRAEAALRESEKRYKSLYSMVRLMCDNVPDLIWAKDLEKKYLFANKAICEKLLKARDTDEPIGKTDTYFTEREKKSHPDDPQWHTFGKKYPESDSVVIESKKPQRFEETGNVNAELLVLDIHKAPFWDERGNVIGTVGCGRIITDEKRIQQEHKRIEEAVRQSEERYRSLVENTLVGYFICEIPSGLFLFLNRRICDLFGYTMQEDLALSIWDVTATEEHGRIREQMRELLEGNRMSLEDMPYTGVRRDGSKCRVEISTSLVSFQSKKVLQGVLRDVTEQERLEQQLIQAQKMEAIGTLAGGIAHDFNNLLMGIQGNASLMLMETDHKSPSFHGRLKDIEEYVQRGADLTKQLLGFAMGGRYEAKPTDLNTVVDRTSHMFGRTKKEIRIHRKYQQDVWTIEADRSQIDQVLLNLYINAWQAMPGGGELYLQTENVRLDKNYVSPYEGQAGDFVKISVTDTGTGMDKATQQRIFEPFFTTKKMGRGTGLGLAAAYGIVRNHGGIINVYSEKGKGTTFNFYLPAMGSAVSRRLSNSKEEDIHKGDETVLLVDDERMIIDVGQNLLNKLGYKVLVAEGGKEALSVYAANRKKIDMVILDMIMPDMSGQEAYERLRELNPEIKVLLASGYSINGHAQKILQQGCDGFIQKPFNITQLSQKIREILDKGR